MDFSFFKNFNQRGISLFFCIVIVSILLAIVLGITAISVSQMKVIKGAGNSVVAYYAADTGMEGILPHIYIASTTEDIVNFCPETGEREEWCAGFVGEEASYLVTIYASTSNYCEEADYFCIRSVGSYRETRRAIRTDF